MIAGAKGVYPVTASLGTADYEPERINAYLAGLSQTTWLVDADRACRELGSAKILNVLLLGAAAASGALGLGLAELEAAIRVRVKPAFVEMNIRALRYGAELIE